MDLYRTDKITADDELQDIRERLPGITLKCLSIYERYHSQYLVDRYLRRLLDGDSYMKLDIIEGHIKPIINKQYFPPLDLDRLYEL